MSATAWVIRCLWIAVIAICTLGGLYRFRPRCRDLRGLQSRQQQIQAENSKMQADILDLKHRQHAFETNPAYVERVARESGMVKSNETVIRLTREPAADAATNLR
jgi:cell division protein FtsB